jgi:hypothetical protein
MDTYFLTASDPDYHIKGSRDPLGFQAIWQKTGRLVIPHLSTISVHLRDFQTLAFAKQFQKEYNINEVDFPAFWLRFEQLMAYSRKKMEDTKILGIREVNEKWNNNPSKLKISSKETIILVNQRGIGVWGRYISPFNKMKVQYDPHFDEIFASKVERLKTNNILNRVWKKEELEVSQQDLSEFKIIFDLSNQERNLWWKYMLESNKDLLSQINKIRDKDYTSFYEFIDLIKQDAAMNLQKHLEDIKHTEFVLSPLNHIFRYLQTQYSWDKKDIENDKFIKKCSNVYHIEKEYFTIEKEVKVNLYNILALENQWEKIKKIVERNQSVMENRGGKAWCVLNGDTLEILHREGEDSGKNYDPEKHNDNNYFLYTYLAFYKALSNN